MVTCDNCVYCIGSLSEVKPIDDGQTHLTFAAELVCSREQDPRTPRSTAESTFYRSWRSPKPSSQSPSFPGPLICLYACHSSSCLRFQERAFSRRRSMLQMLTVTMRPSQWTSLATTATTTSLANSWVGASAWPNMHAHGVRLFEVPDHNTNSTTTTSPPSHPLPPSQTLILPGPHMTRTRTRALRGLDDAALLAAQWPSARWTGVDGHGLRRYRLSPVRIFPSGLRR